MRSTPTTLPQLQTPHAAPHTPLEMASARRASDPCRRARGTASNSARGDAPPSPRTGEHDLRHPGRATRPPTSPGPCTTAPQRAASAKRSTTSASGSARGSTRPRSRAPPSRRERIERRFHARSADTRAARRRRRACAGYGTRAQPPGRARPDARASSCSVASKLYASPRPAVSAAGCFTPRTLVAWRRAPASARRSRPRGRARAPRRGSPRCARAAPRRASRARGESRPPGRRRRTG